MRLDKFLKISRIIKRRTLANQACDSGRVTINDKVAKASSEVQVGDMIAIRFGERMSRYEVLQVKENAAKAEAGDMIRIIEGGLH